MAVLGLVLTAPVGAAAGAVVGVLAEAGGIPLDPPSVGISLGVAAPFVSWLIYSEHRASNRADVWAERYLALITKTNDEVVPAIRDSQRMVSETTETVRVIAAQPRVDPAILDRAVRALDAAVERAERAR